MRKAEIVYTVAMAKHCIPCEISAASMLAKEISFRLPALPGWRAENNHHLIKDFKFSDFKSALEFVNKVGSLAEEEGHHPDIELAWGKVTIKLFTHSISGLSENDFLMAEFIEALANKN
ncbi:MAG: hypothetical protein UX94_C0011G0030 [Parcubacteria group bacterium GW2011_GWA2_47_21]|nr:MAG: hypothetical protein UX94_C0011G0030 [Parcubacteria group bacterium GW2011_GWA2_47_21]